MNSRVREDNEMASFSAYLSKLLHRRGVKVVWETASTSILPRYAPLRTAMGFKRADSVRVPLGAFGDDTEKQIHLFGTAPCLAAVRNVIPEGGRSFGGTLASRTEQGKVTGDKEQLAGSGVYPERFCQEVVLLHRRVANGALLAGGWCGGEMTVAQFFEGLEEYALECERSAENPSKRLRPSLLFTGSGRRGFLPPRSRRGRRTRFAA